MQVVNSFRTRDAGVNKKKLDLWLGPWSLVPSCNLDLKPLGPFKSEPLKKLKRSLLDMFCKIGIIYLQYSQETTCVGVSFLKIDYNTGVSDGCFWQFCHGRVKSAGVPVLWFFPSLCFRFWKENFHETLYK